MPSTGLIIKGDKDDIAPSDMVKDIIKRWQIDPKIVVVEDCDHFYTDRLALLRAFLLDYLA